MKSKFIIVNNGMTGLRGHYFETGVSIASEAQKRSFETLLATHVACDATALAPDLGFYPLFRVDHWGHKVTREVPGLYGLRGSLGALRGTTIEEVIDGRVTMEQYLLSRFDPPDVIPVRANATALRMSKSRRARIQHAAKRILPPLAAQGLRWLVRNRHRGKQLVRGLVPPFLYDGLKRAARRPNALEQPLAAPVRPAQVDDGPISHDSQIEAHLRNALCRINAEGETELWSVFHRDLDRLLCLADVRKDDHIYLPTAHGREAYAVRRLIEEIGEERAPTFHLEFRHAIATLEELETEKQDPAVLYYTRVHQAFFDACRGYPDSAKLRYYTDTDLLAADYGHLAGMDFDVLPIPFRAELIPERAERNMNEGPLKVLFLGDVREEKGFQLLPGLVRALFENYIKTGRLRFVIQAGIHADEPSRALRGAVLELEKYDREHVELIGRDGFLAPFEYYGLLASADVVLCPYLAHSYRARSSGILAEAIVAGKPTVVQEGTWLARQQRSGSGETFSDLDSLVEAVRLVCERYPEYEAGALLERERWQQQHSPERLIERLLGPGTPARADAA
jgi:glycosyltransferase involved in cell wall biosynthesis